MYSERIGGVGKFSADWGQCYKTDGYLARSLSQMTENCHANSGKLQIEGCVIVENGKMSC